MVNETYYGAERVVCDECEEEKRAQFVEDVRRLDDERTVTALDPVFYNAPVCVSCRRDLGLIE